MSASMKNAIGMLVITVGLAACGRDKRTASSDDFSRDLQMASSTVDLPAPKVDPANLSSLETAPASAPQHAVVLKKANSGDRVARSNAPTLRAAPTTDVASTDGMNMTQSADPMPDPKKTNEPVAQVPQPSTTPVDPAGGNGAGDYGTNGSGGDGDYGHGGNGDGGIFGGGGRGPIGVVIHGGGVGDDNCSPPGGVYGGGPRSPRPPVYSPNPGGLGTGRTSPTPGGRSGGGVPTVTTTRRRP